MMARILLVEDDEMIASGLEYALTGEGYEVTLCPDVASALEAVAGEGTTFSRGNFSLGLLDLGLPDGTGYTVCEALRTRGVPVMFLTAVDDEGNVVKGLEMGADDYVTKPFRLRELMARISAVLRRSGGTDTQSQANTPSGADTGVIAAGHGIRIHTREARVTLRSAEVELTALEYRLLLTFAGSPGQVLTRTRLLEGIWDVGGSFVNDNTLSVYVGRLREKLGDDSGNPRIIQTVRGLGYRLATEGTGEYT